MVTPHPMIYLAAFCIGIATFYSPCTAGNGCEKLPGSEGEIQRTHICVGSSEPKPTGPLVYQYS